MKVSFPKIYSLSTLGIIHHYNCDYRFHKTRTDFTGESGSGKSMIADMLQAIFVGSGAYESSTKGNDERPLEGMALKPKGKQFGLGYIFLNIQIAPKQFVVIGIYIESSSRHAQSFILQSGYNWDGDLSPVTTPVFYKDFLVSGNIVPIEQLPEELSKHGLNLKSLPIKKYHQLLYDNHILPVNLSAGGITLDSYANILRSFSRGKGFKKDSDSLKDFLFGNDDESALMRQYKAEVKSISDDYKDHSRYREEIDLINKKQNLIKDILERKKELDKTQKEYLTTKVLYCTRQHELSQRKLGASQSNYAEAGIRYHLLEKREIELLIKEINDKKELLKQYREGLKNVQGKTESLRLHKERQTKVYEDSQKKKNITETVDKWLNQYGGTVEKIRIAYQEDRAKKDRKSQLETFVQYLNQHKIKDTFEASDWLADYKNALKKYNENITEIEEKLDSLEALEIFSDLSNPNSLAAWAIGNLKKALTREQESTLMYFQNLSRTKPVDARGKRYLPFPEELFERLDIKDISKEGFWLNLDGVYEFITFVSKQYFNTNNFDGLRKTLTSLQQQVSNELEQVKSNKSRIEQLKSHLFNFPGLEQAIALYKDRKNISEYEPEPTFAVSEADMNGYFETYKNKNVVDGEYKKAKSAYEKAVSDENSNNQSISNFNNKIKEVEAFFQKKQIAEEQAQEFIQVKNASIKTISEKLEHIRSESGLAISKLESISSKLFQTMDVNDLTEISREKYSQAGLFTTAKNTWEKDKENLEIIKGNLTAAKNDYQLIFKESFRKEKNDSENPTNPDEGTNSLKSRFDAVQAAFKAKYEIALDEVEEKSQLEGSYNLGLLAHKLLPSVFESSRIDENLIDQKIADRLESVSRTIKEIGSRKVEILKKVFTEVYKTYNKYLTKINEIDNYFKTEGKVITGGNRASLKHKKSSDYPDKWMAPFRKQLDEQLTHTGLFEQLLEEVDINTMMKKAFVAAGGSEKVTPEDLLNPKSYFDLTFDLKLESGDNNAGSSGQTYTATALLGIARLSIIEKDEGGRRRSGLRFMPIDEAEGLGGNYDTLCKIAEEEGYQIISMSIEPAGELKHGEQYVYIMNENPGSNEDSYVPPFGIFSEGEIMENIGDFVYGEQE